MRMFSNGQRIKVALEHDEHGMNGRFGTVERMRIKDNGAWVKMDDVLPEKLQSFPAGDSRHTDILLYPEDCEQA